MMLSAKRFNRLLGPLVAAAGLGLVACAPPPPPGTVYVVRRPPPERVEVVSVAPGRDFVWVKGHWGWDRNTYVWVPGRWLAPERTRHRWVQGHWAHDRRGWYWVEGHWR